MTVSEIISLNKRKSKVILDEGFTLILFQGEMNQYGIKEGAEIPQEVYQKIIEEVLCVRAREKALNMLEFSDKTETQIRQKLRGEFYPQEVIDHAVAYLLRNGLLNDSSYARRYVESNQQKKSRRQIQFDLRQRGIEQDEVSGLLEELPVDEDNQIRKLIQRKKSAPSAMDQKERNRLMASLARKGFSFEAVNRVLRQMEEDC